MEVINKRKHCTYVIRQRCFCQTKGVFRRPFGRFTTCLPATLATFPVWPGYWQDFGRPANGHSSNLDRRQTANACFCQDKWAFSNVATFRQMTACQMCRNIRVTVEKNNMALCTPTRSTLALQDFMKWTARSKDWGYLAKPREPDVLRASWDGFCNICNFASIVFLF